VVLDRYVVCVDFDREFSIEDFGERFNWVVLALVMGMEFVCIQGRFYILNIKLKLFLLYKSIAIP